MIFIGLDLKDSFGRKMFPKWPFYCILTFSSKFQIYLTYFQVNIMKPKVLGIVYVYTINYMAIWTVLIKKIWGGVPPPPPPGLDP